MRLCNGHHDLLRIYVHRDGSIVMHRDRGLLLLAIALPSLKGKHTRKAPQKARVIRHRIYDINYSGAIPPGGRPPDKGG